MGCIFTRTLFAGCLQFYQRKAAKKRVQESNICCALWDKGQLLFNVVMLFFLLLNAIKCYRMLSNAIECYRMLSNAIECYRMLSNAIECYQMLPFDVHLLCPHAANF